MTSVMTTIAVVTTTVPTAANRRTSTTVSSARPMRPNQRSHAGATYQDAPSCADRIAWAWTCAGAIGPTGVGTMPAPG